MERRELPNEVVYASTEMAEIDLAKKILNYLKIEFQVGASNRGSTLHIRTSDDAAFQKEVLQWEDAARGIHNSFRVCR